MSFAAPISEDLRPLRVLMTTDTLGGVWTYAVALTHQIVAHGGEVALVTAGRPLSAAQRRAFDHLRRVQIFETHFRLEWMQEPWDDVDAMGQSLLEIARIVRPDIVHLNDYSHGSLRWDAPVVVVGHSCVLSWMAAVRGAAMPDLQWETYRRRVRAGLRGADLVVAPTAWMLESLESFYGPLGRSLVISNGRDIPRDLRTPRAGSVAKEPFILFAGRLWDEAKNAAVLAEAASQTPWRILLAGDAVHPDTRRAFDTGARRGTPRRVRLLGMLPPEDLRDCYARASIYALPALYEPFGLTALEAAAHGCALVLSDIPSLREVWGDAALYVAPRDASAWSAAFTSLIEQPGRLQALAGAAFERAQRYDAAIMGEKYLEAYRSIRRRRPATVWTGEGARSCAS
jgi:glycogen synthase